MLISQNLKSKLQLQLAISGSDFSPFHYTWRVCNSIRMGCFAPPSIMFLEALWQILNLLFSKAIFLNPWMSFGNWLLLHILAQPEHPF
jgi:hypothetical protein